MSKKERANLNLPLPCSRVLQASLLAQSLFFEETPSQRTFTQKQSRFADIGSKALIALKFRTSLANARKSQDNLAVKDAEENGEMSQLDKSVNSEWRKSFTSSASPKKDNLESFSSRKLQELLKPVLSNKARISLQDLPADREFTASIDLDLCNPVEADLPVPSSKFRESFQNKNRKVLQKNASIDEKMASENNLFGEDKVSSVAQSTNHIKSFKSIISRPKTSSIDPVGKKSRQRPKSKASKLLKAISIQEIYNNYKHPLISSSKPSTTNLRRETTPPPKSRNKFRRTAPPQVIESMPNIEIKVSPPSDSLKPPIIMIRDRLDLLKQDDDGSSETFGLSKGKSMTCLGSNNKTPKESHKKKGRKLKSLKAEIVLPPEKETFREKVILKSSSKKGFKTFFVGELKKIYKPRLDQDRLKSFKAC